MGATAWRVNSFIERHSMAWELAMAGLAIVYVGVGFLDENAITAAGAWLLTAVFACEFVGRLAISPDRRAYLRGHWIDVVALIPTTRALRLLRLLRLVRASAGLFRALSQVERLASHRNLIWLFVLWLSVAVICSIWLYAVEADTNPAIASPLDAVWWGIVTLTTVGYGDVYPRTGEGRLAAVVLMVLGITLYSTITATVTSILIAGRSGETDRVGQLERLVALERNGSLTPDEFERAKATIIQ